MTNTKFKTWWKRFDVELKVLGLAPAGFKLANECYYSGDTPKNAAQKIAE